MWFGACEISGLHLAAVEEDAESEDVQLVSRPGKRSAARGGSRVPQTKAELGA